MVINKVFYQPVLALLISACFPASAMLAGPYEIGLNISIPTMTDTSGLKATPTLILQTTTIQESNQYSLEALKNRTYGDGDFTVDRLWYTYDRFDRYYVIYDSDGLSIHGFVNVPKGEGPHPVIIALHGSVPRDEYTTLDYSFRYADDLAKNGYIVLHPNLRTYPPSDSGPGGNDFHAGYTIDVLNLLAYLREMAGQEGIFITADISQLGIWGHSMGGSIAMRVMSVEPDAFKAALLYAAVSQRYGGVMDGSDIYDLSNVLAQISIHHGENDDVIPVEHSKKLCLFLELLGRGVECHYYPGQPHTFNRDLWADPLLMKRTLELFDNYVKNDIGK